MLTTREKGTMAEKYAEKKLRNMGYKIIGKNFATRYGEIDIIAKKGEYLVFVEVRCRAGEEFGAPAETVGSVKRQRLRRVAEEYIAKNNLDEPMRFDVFEILGAFTGGRLKVERFEVYENAF